MIEQLKREAENEGWADRAGFFVADAGDLNPVTDCSVDVVMTRSVLIYVPDKAAAFRAIYRVLRPGGRVSLFEPINSLQYPEAEDRFLGYDVGPVQEMAARVKRARFDPSQPAAKAMIDFDDRDLVALASAAGFYEVNLTLELRIGPMPPIPDFDVLLESSPNPLSPTLRESINHALAPAEATTFVTHMRNAVAASIPVRRTAVAYLVARRSS